MRAPRVAIIHYWLVGMRGGERVLERILRLYPNADIFTHVYDPSSISGEINSHTVKTSFIQRLPGARRHYQKYLPLMPLALEELDLTGYDLIISSESGPAKGVVAPIDAYHLCYCHSPMRYVWDHYHRYRSSAGFVSRAAMPLLTHYLRSWDTSSAQRVDTILANSSFVQSRIRRAWGRPSTVVHPPVQTAMFAPSRDIGDHFLWVGQMIAYKRPDLAVDAFNRLGLPLLMVGEGDMLAELRRRAAPNIRFIARLAYAELRRAYAECRALVFPAEEDFGIVPVEANAAGRPVIAYRRGGASETIVPGITGLFFDEQSVDALADSVRAFEAWLPDFRPADAVLNAGRFSVETFDRNFLAVIADGMGASAPQDTGSAADSPKCAG